VLDVHAPHEPIIGWKDFLLHLFTITVGLLIALSLEGVVEWQHHRHLVHEAEASLHGEIERNAKSLQSTTEQLHQNQADLKHDAAVLKAIIATGKMPEHDHMNISFAIHGFDGVGWKTAQATGAFAYMPYERAQEYADIYTTQDELADAEHVAARDTIIGLAPFINTEDKDPNPTKADAQVMKEKIEVLQSQLLLVDSLMKSLGAEYQKFLAAHPES
jgi:hypothetical protein